MQVPFGDEIKTVEPRELTVAEIRKAIKDGGDPDIVTLAAANERINDSTIAAACGLTPDQIGKLRFKDYQILAEAVLKVNADFFGQGLDKILKRGSKKAAEKAE